VESTLLMTSRLTPICTPGYLARHGGALDPLAPRDLLQHPLFFEFDPAHWRQWFAAAGVDGPLDFSGVRIDDSHALRKVVLDGHGFGLFFVELIQEDLRLGKLAQPFDRWIDPGCAYYLNRPRQVPAGPRLQTFTQWILAEVARNPFV
jgi:LysR family glycine cleavage system transcriptional activator